MGTLKMTISAPRTSVKTTRWYLRSASIVIPGIALCVVLASGCFVIAHQPALNQVVPISPLMLAIFVGITVRLIVPGLAPFERGIGWTLHYALRAGIILLGFRLVFSDLVSVGIGGLVLIVISVVSTFGLTLICGRCLKLPDSLSALIATGTSICGASAVVAVDGVIHGREQDVVCAVALATVFGTVLMFGDPLIAHACGMPEAMFSAWAGTSVHEVAQAVAAGFTFGSHAGAQVSVYKLARVAMLVPLCGALGIWWRRRARNDDSIQANPRFPLFILFFLGAVVMNSALPIGQTPRHDVIQLDGGLLTVAMVAMGLKTRIEPLLELGWRPIVLGLIATLWISFASLTGAWLLF